MYYNHVCIDVVIFVRTGSLDAMFVEPIFTNSLNIIELYIYIKNYYVLIYILNELYIYWLNINYDLYI